MTRNLKALGLALIAAFAMSAVAASAASAVNHHFTGTAGDALTTESIGEQVFESTTGEGKGYKCKKVVTEKGTVPAGTVTSVATTPKYEECESFGPTAKAKVTQNECEFVFTGNTTPGNPTNEAEHANVDIVCPTGKSIIIDVTGLNLNCSTIYPQEVEHAVRYENETTAGNGKTHVRVKATAHGIESTTIGVCGEKEPHNNGSYTGEVTVSTPNGISISNGA